MHALLAANPSLEHAEGLGALCAVIAQNLPEEAGFMVAQRPLTPQGVPPGPRSGLLHGFLWPFYGPQSIAFRRHGLRLFGALLGFVDPVLQLRLQELGMQPDAYASNWFPTWFAQLLPSPELLWDAMLLQPPQFQLFVGLCLVPRVF